MWLFGRGFGFGFWYRRGGEVYVLGSFFCGCWTGCISPFLPFVVSFVSAWYGGIIFFVWRVASDGL